MLETDNLKLSELTSQEGFDPSKLEVKLEINNITLRVEDFNDILSTWAENLTKKVQRDLDYNSSEKAVVAKAQELIQGKMGKVYEALSDIENSLWKLEE